MQQIPILKIGYFLLISIQVDMDDQVVLQLQENLTERISQEQVKGVLLDISSLDMVDSYIGRMLATLSAMSKILGAETVVVGMQPAVAMTIVELGLDLSGINTAINAERGMAMLKERR
jgi:rsbT antagonist protein RsbS